MAEEPYVSIVELRRQHRRAVIAGVAGVVIAALLAFVAILVAGRTDGAKVTLGDDVFSVGRAEVLLARIEKDAGTPLLFQDLVGGSRDIWVLHAGEDIEDGWTALLSTAPGQPRTCQLRWEAPRFVDPCTKRTYPPTGVGLDTFPVAVRDGRVFIDLRS